MKLFKRQGRPDLHAAAPNAPTTESVLRNMRGIPRVCRQLFGIPDYERYLAHAAARHPGAPVLSRREFCAKAIERKYGKNGPRCC